jgi:hypothetical protein
MGLGLPTPRQLKSEVLAADTSHMPITVTMAFSHDSDQPGGNDGSETSRAEPSAADEAPVEDGITPERLQQVIQRLGSGFYDRVEVRDKIARRVHQELDSL